MDFFKKTPIIDLWSYLSSTSKTIVMYGMGNGADKILNVCQKYNVEIADFFASDGFVRGHSFHGKRVLSFSEIKEKYGRENLIILLSFGSSLPDVLSLFKSINQECELYAPDVPVCGENIFTLDFFKENQEKILKLLVKYLKCGKEYEQEENKQPSMSFTQDEGYIKASFMSDYHIDLDKDTLHWWEFYDDLVGLTDNCILNRVRRVREEPLKGKKGEELHRWQEAKKAVALKVEKTKREKELDEYWEHLLNQKGE